MGDTVEGDADSEQAFLRAMELRRAGKGDEALRELEGIRRREPRYPEPHLEIGRILYEREQWEEAEAEVREAIRLLELGGQWLDEIPEGAMQAMCWSLLGEVLKERAATDEVVFGDPEGFHALIRESRAAFERAAQLDPDDLASRLSADELAEGGAGENGEGGDGEGGDGEDGGPGGEMVH